MNQPDLSRTPKRLSWRLSLCLVAAYALLLAAFPFRINTYESYMYGLATEGSYKIQTTFEEVNPQGKLADFSRYHPNHPLIHWMAGELYDYFDVRALTTTRILNFIGSLVALFFLLQIAAFFTRRRGLVLLATFMTATTTVFWMLALSGEIHMPAFAFVSAALYLLCRYFLNTRREARWLLGATSLFTFAGALHSAAYFSGPIAFVALLIDQYRLKDKKLQWRYFVYSAFIVLGGLFFFYGYLLVKMLQITSLQEYIHTLTIYSYLGYGQYTRGEWFRTLVESYAQSLMNGFTAPILALKFVLVGVFIYGLYIFSRSQIAVALRFLLISPFFFFFLGQAAFNVRPDSINGWLFVLPSFLIGILFAMRRFSRRLKWPVAVLVLALLPTASNFKEIILPNATLDRAEYFYLKPVATQILQETPKPRILGVAIDPIVSFPDYYDLTSTIKGKSLDIIWSCCGRTGYKDILRKAVKEHRVDWIISDALAGDTQEILKETGAKTRLVFDKQGNINTDFFSASLYVDMKKDYQVRKRMQVIRIR